MPVRSGDLLRVRLHRTDLRQIPVIQRAARILDEDQFSGCLGETRTNDLGHPLPGSVSNHLQLRVLTGQFSGRFGRLIGRAVINDQYLEFTSQVG